MNGKCCIGLLCVAIIITFVAMCYLMKDINPPPLPPDDPTKLEQPEKPSSRELKVSKDFVQLNFENVIFGDAAPRLSDDIQFGLEKVNTDNIQHSTYPPHQEPAIATENFDLWKYTEAKVPPVWPKTTSVVRKPTLTSWPSNTTEAVNETTTIRGIQTSSVPVKRSVKVLTDDEDDEFQESIIVNIKDDTGRFNIEIKLAPTDIFKRRRYRQKKSQPQNKSKFSLSLQNKIYDQFKQNDLVNNTMISIMANDSVIVDEYNDQLREEKIIVNNLVTEYQKENVTDNTGVNVLDIQNSTDRNNTDYDNILFIKTVPQENVTDNTGLNVLDSQNSTDRNNTDYDNILFIKTVPQENITDNTGLNVLDSQNSTDRNNTDYDNILFIKTVPQLNIITEMPTYKDIYTLNVLFDNKTQSIKHSNVKRNDTNNSFELEDLQKLTNISDEYEIKLYNDVVTNITDLNNSSSVSTEDSTIQNQYSIIEILTSPITTTNELSQNLTSNTENLNEDTESSTIENENFNTPLQEQNIQNDSVVQFEITTDLSNNDSTSESESEKIINILNTTVLMRKKQDSSHNNETYFM